MIVTLVATVATLVVIVNKGEEEEPAAMVMVGGTTANGLLLLSETTKPPGGAVPVRLTRFAVVDNAPTTTLGDRITLDNATGAAVSEAVRETPL